MFIKPDILKLHQVDKMTQMWNYPVWTTGLQAGNGTQLLIAYDQTKLRFFGFYCYAAVFGNRDNYWQYIKIALLELYQIVGMIEVVKHCCMLWTKNM